MGSSAELGRVIADLDHPHRLAVLVAEEGDGSHLLGLILGGDRGGHLVVRDQSLVDLGLDRGELLGSYLGEMGEVEAQSAGLHERTGLVGVVPKDIAKRPVQNMGAGVALAGRLTARAIDGRANCLPDGEITVGDPDLVAMESLDDMLSVDYDGASGFGIDHSGIANLTARLGIEGCLV